MILYRSSVVNNSGGGGGGGTDNSASYTATVNGIICNGSGAYLYCNGRNLGADKNIVFGKNLTDYFCMFDNATVGGNFYFKTKSTNINVMHMFVNCHTAYKKNLFFNSAINNFFNVTTGVSLVGQAITWTEMTNGFYNTSFNIYCYYNY